jgi:hypothetical protein
VAAAPPRPPGETACEGHVGAAGGTPPAPLAPSPALRPLPR